jgi:hypothetical protein
LRGLVHFVLILLFICFILVVINSPLPSNQNPPSGGVYSLTDISI